MERIGKFDKRHSQLRVDTPYEAGLLDVHLPVLSLASRKTRTELQIADRTYSWPTVVAVGNRALNFAAGAMEQRANNIEVAARWISAERVEPEVAVLRQIAAIIREPEVA